MENLVPISFLNDFIFCPRSIYFHQLYGNFDEIIYQSTYQTEGKNVHQSIDNKNYSDRTTILQATEVVSQRYGIYGKIDIFDIKKGILTERKKEIKTIYDGYIFQVFAQYFGLTELGYQVNKIFIYDFSHNKIYPIALPENNPTMLQKFENTIEEIKNFSLLNNNFIPNKGKCDKCIYNALCDRSLC